MPPDPAAGVFHPADYWRSRNAADALLGLAQLRKAREAVAASPEGAAGAAQEAQDLSWMVRWLSGHMDPNDPHETVVEVVAAARVSDGASRDQMAFSAAARFDELVDRYALRCPLPPGD